MVNPHFASSTLITAPNNSIDISTDLLSISTKSISQLIEESNEEKTQITPEPSG